MRQTVLPGTDLRTSRLGFGTASLHHLFRSRDRQALLNLAFDVGITHFDTARMYGEGLAEHELGKFCANRRQQITLATKFGIPADPYCERFPPLIYARRALDKLGRRVRLPARSHRRQRLFTPAAAEASLARSLAALHTDWIDILFVHEPRANEADALLQMADWFARQKRDGRVRCLGLAGKADDCVTVMQQTGDLFDLLQVEDSLLASEADVVTRAGFPLQITFGYLRRAAEQHSQPSLATLRAALAKNEEGMVLVSSRRAKRVREMATLTDG